MSSLDRRSGSQRSWLYGVYVAALLCLLGAMGAGWRTWRAERRGVEGRGGSDAEPHVGINVALEQYAPDERARALSDIGALGFQWVRQRFPWRAIEPAEGAYDWSSWDAVVSAVADHELGLIAVLDDPPAWALRHDPYPLPCVPPCYVDAYARYASAFAARYGNQIDHYQVWDEPNLSRAWGGGHAAPCGYAVLLEETYAAIHEADPLAQVLGGGLAPTQAPGPGDLNDLVYLRQLLAFGGGDHLDVLAVKPYGFWSGPQDRRVAPDVLNYSRVVAVRELMRGYGHSRTRIWAVEWGWNALPEGWDGSAPPWGTDGAEVQGARVLGAIARAENEWPWLRAMLWAEYQPDVSRDDPRWGFALRDADGAPTALYDFLRIAIEPLSALVVSHTQPSLRWSAFLGLLALASADGCVLWIRLRCGAILRKVWHRWVVLPAPTHLGVLALLAALYALLPWPEWLLLLLALAAALFYVHPRWALIGAVGTIPFFYVAKPLFGAIKPLGGLQMPPSETLLYLYVLVTIARYLGARRWPRLASGWGVLDVVWGMWVAWGAASLMVAPDLALAWHEWRLSIFDPALLYLALRATDGELWAGTPVPRRLLSAWLFSGAAVSLVGVVQWVTGTLVPSGGVGRVTGVYYSPNHLALYLDRIWPVALSLALCADLEVGRRRRAWGMVLLIGAALYLTYSRGTWLLAIPVALIPLGWCYRKRLRWWGAIGVLVALLLVASNVLYGRLVSHAGLLDEVRIPVWQSTWHMIRDHPWWGVGLDGYRYTYQRYMQVAAWTEPLLHHPHNAWLDAAVRLGLPGLVLYGALIGLCIRTAARWARSAQGIERALALGCTAGLLAGLAHGLVDSGYFLADLAWSLALVAGVVQAHRAGQWHVDEKVVV